MNTPSHVILNLALLGHRSRPHAPVFWGALVPDLAMFVFYAWAKLIAQLDEATIWRETFFEPFWQVIFAVGNSIPLALLMMAIALGLKRYAPTWHLLSNSALFLAASMLLHDLADLPLHAEDGHRHFWPLSNYRFASPVSYWDPDYHGTLAALGELCLVFLASWRIWRLLRSRWARILLLASNVLMGLGYVGFYLR